MSTKDTESDSGVQPRATKPLYELHTTLNTPAPVSCLLISRPQQIVAGSDDGSVRIYNTRSYKVEKAIRGLKAEVSSVACPRGDKSEFWIASGSCVYNFLLDAEKLIYTLEDARHTIRPGTEEDDVLNEITLNDKDTQLAVSLDSGVVSIVDLATRQVTSMKTRHNNICGTLKFIPDRPRELVSGGYDSALLHFDFLQGSVLSRYNIDALPPSSGISLSPPFLLSLAISPTGAAAGGTADGRIWIGLGGEKTPSGVSSKKKKKWEGLKAEASFTSKTAEGPVVALTFAGPRRVVSVTLLGQVSQHNILGTAEISLKHEWSFQTKAVAKANALVVSGDRIFVGGLTSEGRGIIEVWLKVEGVEP